MILEYKNTKGFKSTPEQTADNTEEVGIMHICICNMNGYIK